MTLPSTAWLVLLGGAVGVRGLEILLVPARTEILHVELRSLTTGVVFGGSVDGRRVSFRFPSSILGPDFVGLLKVTFTQDTPLIGGSAWIGGRRLDGPLFSHAIPADVFVQAGLIQPPSAIGTRPGVPPLLLSYLWQTLLADRAISIPFTTAGEASAIQKISEKEKRIHVLRRAAMDMDERARRFFFSLDVGTLSPGIPASWRQTMGSVNDTLASRVHARAAVGRTHVPEWLQSDRFSRRLQTTSAFVQALVLTNLYDGDGEDLVDWAFTRFAVESLAVSHRDPESQALLQSHGAPDGDAYFRFGELALACIDDNVDREFWLKHLGTFVRTSHAYAEHAGERGVDGRYGYGFRPNRRFPLTRLGELQCEYTVPSGAIALEFYEDLFTHLVAQALEVDLAGGVPTKRELRHTTRLIRQDANRDLAELALDFFERVQLLELLASIWPGKETAGSNPP